MHDSSLAFITDEATNRNPVPPFSLTARRFSACRQISCAKFTHFMRKGLKRLSQKDISRATKSISRQSTHFTQHGQQHSSLLYLLPAESLTHITSFLDPVSLRSLAQTSRKLYEHVGDDNTWRRAFFCQFLGVSPENALKGVKVLTYRLTQRTWKQEFVHRHTMRR